MGSSWGFRPKIAYNATSTTVFICYTILMRRLLPLFFCIMLLSCQMAADETITPIAKLPTVVSTAVTLQQTTTLIPSPPSTETKIAPTDDLPATSLPTLRATQLRATAVPSATQQDPTVVVTQIATSRPSPTPSLPPTATPSDVEPTVNYFRFAAPLTKPSAPALLEWDVQGVERVTISRNGGEWAEAGQQWLESNQDSMEHTFPASVGGWPVTYVLTSPDAPNLRSEFTVTVPCEFEWAFSFDYPGDGCPVEPIISAAAFQPFEDGFMLWTEDLDQILYSTWNGLTNGERTDGYDSTIDPIRFDSIVPPAGYLQPEYGFGKLWREDDFVRQTLGWAVGQTINFTTIRQSEPGTRYGNYQAFIGLPNDERITIDVPKPSWTISYPNPNVARAEQRPPAVIAPMTTVEPLAIVVNYFRFATQPTKPTKSVLLEWDVSGVEAVEISRAGGEWNQAEAQYELPAKGTIVQSFIPELGGWPIIYIMTACNENQCIEEVFSAELPCEYPVIIEAIADSQRCLTKGIISHGSQQNFENGFMIWIEAQDVIIYSTWDGATHAELVDTFEHGVDPIDDPSIVPPDGLYQPAYGFGKIWREENGVRDLLGWATDWGTEYTVKRQSQPLHRYGFQEWITLTNGGLITINHPNPTWVIE